MPAKKLVVALSWTSDKRFYVRNAKGKLKP